MQLVSPPTSCCAALSLVMLLYLWGSCIAYLVIIGDSFGSLLKLAVGTASPLQPYACCLPLKLLLDDEV